MDFTFFFLDLKVALEKVEAPSRELCHSWQWVVLGFFRGTEPIEITERERKRKGEVELF